MFILSPLKSGKIAQSVLLGAFILALIPELLSAADVPKPGTPPGFRIIAQDDCGRPGQEPHLVSGADWTFSAEEEADLQIDDDRMRTFNHDPAAVVYRYNNLDPKARYQLRLFFFNVARERMQTVTVNGKVMSGTFTLPKGKLLEQDLTLTPALTSGGSLDLRFNNAGGFSALVSAIELWSNAKESPVPPPVEGGMRKPLSSLDLKDGDTVVFLGDSITHHWEMGCMYTQYVEDYFYTRYPKRHLHFRNAGVSSDTAACALTRFTLDVARYKPKYVTVLLGMNDAGYTDFDADRFTAYERTMRLLLNRIAEIPATAVLMSTTPFDFRGVELNPVQGPAVRAKWRPYNSVLSYYGTWLYEEAMQRGIGWVDLRSALERHQIEQRRTNPTFTLIPDSIHPAAPGQFIMAATLLEAMNPNGIVSTIEANRTGLGWVANSHDGVISGTKQSPEAGLSFTFQAESLPWVPPPEALRGYQLADAGHLLSRETLRVSGLPPGGYELRIDGKTIGRWSDVGFGIGIELQSVTNTPQYQQGLAVTMLNKERNAKAMHPMRLLFEAFKESDRLAGKLPSKDEVDQFTALAADYERRIYIANQPLPHRYEIVRMQKTQPETP